MTKDESSHLKDQQQHMLVWLQLNVNYNCQGPILYLHMYVWTLLWSSLTPPNTLWFLEALKTISLEVCTWTAPSSNRILCHKLSYIMATFKSRNKEILCHIKMLLLAAALILYDVININIY